MKKILLFLFLLAANADLSAQRFEGGILGGLIASQVDGDQYKGFHKPGLALGAFVQTDLTRSVYAGMELKLIQKGSRNIDSLATDGQIKYLMRLNYVDLPVFLGFRTSEKIAFILGASPGYLISGKEYNDYGRFSEQDQKAFQHFDLQGLLGFRFKFSRRLSFEIRGAYSLLPIRKQSGEALWYWRSNQFNNLLSTTAYYRLDL
jgi:hypothetical protein